LQTAEQTDLPSSVMSPSKRDSRYVVVGILMVAFTYGLILGLSLWRTGHFAPVIFPDEKIYVVRILDAFRGNALGNPYIAEHESALQYMPTIGEHALASAAKLTHIEPLTVVALSRVLFPVAIFVLVFYLARSLRLEPGAALLAGLLAVLAPGIKGNPFASDLPLALRYFRVISPALFVLLMMVALRCIRWTCESRGALAWVSAGLSCGLLFYTQVYFWTFVGLGVLLLAIRVDPGIRKRLALVCVIAIVIGIPNLIHMAKIRHDPEVRETLRRAGIVDPSGTPLPPAPEFGTLDSSLDPDLSATDISPLPRFVIGAIVCAVIWLTRKRIQSSIVQFILPFCIAGTLLLEQHIISGRELQDIHWLGCLIPLWAIAAAAVAGAMKWRTRTVIASASVLVFLSGAAIQVAAYRTLERCTLEDMEWWDLGRRMPATLHWLNKNTAPDTVVIAKPAIMDSLPLFTHTRPYWTGVAAQHVMSDTEVAERIRSVQQWSVQRPIALPYRADLALITEEGCSNPPLPKLYSNPGERTCVLALGPDR
jgi:hypothetical protein